MVSDPFILKDEGCCISTVSSLALQEQAWHMVRNVNMTSAGYLINRVCLLCCKVHCALEAAGLCRCIGHLTIQQAAH